MNSEKLCQIGIGVLIVLLLTISSGEGQSLNLPREVEFKGLSPSPEVVSATTIITPARKKSVKLAILMSGVMPGWGQWYAGSKRHAFIFLGTEAMVWSARGWFKTRQKWYEDDYKLWATTHAGINPNGKSSAYFNALQDYRSSDEYNEEQRRDARFADGEPDHLYVGEDAWEWETTEAWREYDAIKDDAWHSEQWASYMIGAALINRLIAMVDAARLAHQHNQQIQNQTEIHFHLNEDPQEMGFQIGLIRKF